MVERTERTDRGERFQSREELVQFIEQEATTAVAQALPTGASRVERRLPWVTTGPIGRDSAGYSMLKAAAYALGYLSPDQAKEELQTHEQLRQLYAGYGFHPHHGAQSFLVPWASAHLPTFEPQGQRLQAELRQKLHAAPHAADPDEIDWLGRRVGLSRKALTLAGETDGFFQWPILGELIDLQRNLEAFATAGAREVALPAHGRIVFPRLQSSSTAYWVGEGAAITESQPVTGHLELSAKKLGVLVKLNNELLRFASPSAEALVRYDMARAAAQKADQAMLEGTGGTQIRGLLNLPGLVTHTAQSVGSDGNRFEPEDVALMESLLPDTVEEPTAWLMRKALFAALMNRRLDAIEAEDARGPFVFSPTRGVAMNRPQTLFGTPVVRTAQIPANRSKGSANNLTYILLGYFPDWIVARLGVMEFLVGNQGDSALQNDMTILRGIQHIDAGPRQIGSFVVCDQLQVG